MADPADRWRDALLAIRLFCADPWHLGGIRLRAAPGPVRDQWLAHLNDALRDIAAVRRMPAAISDEALIGGIDWQAGVGQGKFVFRPGLLPRSDLGILLIPMAERLARSTAATLCQTLDTGLLQVAREGVMQHCAARIGVIALDEGIDGEEQTPISLSDRLAFSIDLDGLSVRDLSQSQGDAPRNAQRATHSALNNRADQSPLNYPSGPLARVNKPLAVLGNDCLQALCALTLELGVESVRANVFAARAAAVLASMDSRDAVVVADCASAARLILAPRATRLPAPNNTSSDAPSDNEPTPPEPAERGEAPEQPDPNNQSGQSDQSAQSDQSESSQDNAGPDQQQLQEMIVAATRSALPEQLLSGTGAMTARRQRPLRGGRFGSGSGTGDLQRSALRGRPIGVARAESLHTGRLDILQTVMAAAPWQKLRRRTAPGSAAPAGAVLIHRDDFRLKRFVLRRQTSTLFVLDASGSAALNRLAEAKGAVELLLAESYVRRDRVAVITFRGKQALLALPPTRSLVRARRCLVGLAGGGGTPLALALDAAIDLGLSEHRGGRTPKLVILTDGRANIARDGTANRLRAQEDALQSARHARAALLDCLWIDTAPRPQPDAGAIAHCMGARYIELPFADAKALMQAVQSADPGRAAEPSWH
jgi:magnesium chelatase subunit D